MPPEDNPYDDDPLGECRYEIHRLEQKNKTLQSDLDLANCYRESALKALEAFRGYNGDDDL